MPEFVSALIYDSAINLSGLERDKNAAIAKLHSIGTEATKTFQNEIARSLAKSVRPEVFAGDLAKSRALLQGFGDDATKIFDRALGRQAARRMFQPFIDETKTLTGQLKGILATNFSPRNLLLGVAGGIGLERIGTELVNFGKDAVVFAADFETSLTKIKTIADRGTDINKIGDSLQTLSTRIPQDLLTLSEGLFNIIGSGISDSAEALKVLDVAARAATAGFTDTKFAADAIVFSINAFSKTAEDAEAIANTLFKTVDVGKIEFKDLATNIGEVANPAAIAGVSLQELGQAIATITLGGTPVSETFTALKNFLQSIIAPTDGARKAAKEFGLEFSKAGIAAAGGLEQFVQKIREATGGDTQKLDKLFPEARALRAAQILTNTLADTYVRLGDEFSNVTKKSGEMQKAFEDVNNSGAAQAKLFTNNLKLATLELGKAILEGLSPALKAANRAFAENEKVVGNYVKAVIGWVKLLGNAQLAALLGFGALFQNKVASESGKFVLPADERTKALKENAETIKKAIEEFEAKMQPVSDDVQTLSASAEDTANAFERSAKAMKEIEKLASKIKSTSIVDEFFKDRTSIINRFDKDQLGKIKLIVDLPETDTAKKIKLMQQAQDELDAELEQLHRTQQGFVDLADIFDRSLGDIAASFFRLKDILNTPGALGIEKIVAGFSTFNTVLGVFGVSLLGTIKSLFGANENFASIELERKRQALSEQDAENASRRLTDALKDLRTAIDGGDKSIQQLENLISGTFAEVGRSLGGFSTDLRTRFFSVISDIFDKLPKKPESLEELLDFFRSLQGKLPDEFTEILNDIVNLLFQGGPGAASFAKLLGELLLGFTGLTNFGKKLNREFDDLIDRLNLKFDLLNIDDPLKKLDLLAKGIRDKFKAIIPITDTGIRDLIAKGLEALEAGGQTLVDFLKSLDLEELTADQFRDLLQLLNNLANEAKSKVAGIDDPTTRVSLIRSITFEQGNRLLDENTTMRILQTNMVDIQLQMLSIMKDSLRGGLSSAPLSRGGAANIFIMRDGNMRRASTSELTELERLQADRFLAEAKGMGLA